jgi:hypothetical protein
MKHIMLIGILFITGMHLMAGEPAGLEFNRQRFSLLSRAQQRMDSVSSQQAGMQKKSVFLAAVYSAVIPGAGEFYGRSYWKAAIFLGAELAGWTTYLAYDHKGNVGDKNMRAYADKNWNEQRYWSKLYYEARHQGGIPNLPDYDLQEVDNGYLLMNYSPQMVNSLRFLEDALGYTHKLPATKSQQYYEMIYKYLTQFGTGWQDADFFLTYYGNTDRMTPMMFEYRGMRNEMNHYYDIASGSLNVILINHVLSSLDAAFTTRRYNCTLAASIRVKPVEYFGEKVNLYALQLSW